MPTTYLGLPLGSLSKAQGAWYHIIEKVEPHFVGLKKMYLSKGERITFIKSTLSSHSIDFICFFKMPIHLANRLEYLQGDFL